MPSDRQRRDAERRRRRRQLQRRYERHLRRRRFLVASSVVGVLIIAAIVVTVIATSGGGGTTTAAKTPGTTPSPSGTSSSADPSYPCTFAASGTSAKKGVKAPTDTRPDLEGKVSVAVATNRGKMTFTLDRSEAPCAVASFVSLVQQHYYDRTPCHRLVTENIFILQCGDPTGTGKGGPGYTVNDEGTGTETYKAGAIAMARTEAADSTGSQFFIVYKDSPGLQRGLGLQQYTEFGTVTSGLDVVTKVAAGGAVGGSDGKPKLPLTVTSMTAPTTGQ